MGTASAVQAGGSVIGGIIPIIIPIVILGLLGLFIYFIPSLVANKRQHIQKTSILLLNIFLGWTFVGWVVALIWATLKDKNQM